MNAESEHPTRLDFKKGESDTYVITRSSATMFRIIAVLAFVAALFVPASAQVQMVRPDPINHPTWMVPCDHPIAAQYGLSCSTPAPAPAPTQFVVGRVYERVTPALGTRLYIVAAGVGSAGVPVLAAECLNVVPQDSCYYPGEGRFILANANTLGWRDLGPLPGR